MYIHKKKKKIFFVMKNMRSFYPQNDLHHCSPQLLNFKKSIITFYLMRRLIKLCFVLHHLLSGLIL